MTGFCMQRKGEGGAGWQLLLAGPLPAWVLAYQASETENKVSLNECLFPGGMSLPHLAEMRESWLFFLVPF